MRYRAGAGTPCAHTYLIGVALGIRKGRRVTTNNQGAGGARV
jgi:hypothetical protein